MVFSFRNITTGLVIAGVVAFGGWMYRMEKIGTQLLEQKKATDFRFNLHKGTLEDHETRIRLIEAE